MFQTHQRSENNEDEVIEMIKKPLSVARVAAFCLPLALVASCGSSSWPEGVQGTTVNFNPSTLGSITLDIEYSGAYEFSQVFRIELLSPTGYPQIAAELMINSGHVVYAGAPIITCDKVTHVCILPPDLPISLPYKVITDSSGTATFTVRYDLYSNQTGDIPIIEAWSGTSYSSVSVPVECGDSDDTDGTPACL
jgi:hypothetical protein